MGNERTVLMNKTPKNQVEPDLAARLMELLDQQPSELPKLDRLIDIRAFGELSGWSRTTILRAEGLGHIPRRRKLPNGQTAFLATEVAEWIKSLPAAPLPNIRQREATYQ
jgi:predicted DNA-binding transcriptional regulator AlpA